MRWKMEIYFRVNIKCEGYEYLFGVLAGMMTFLDYHI